MLLVLSCETKLEILSRFCFLKVSHFLGATANLGVLLPKISNKALWKLGVTPKFTLNDGQKRVESNFSPSFKNRTIKFSKSRQKIPPNDIKSFGSNMGVKN